MLSYSVLKGEIVTKEITSIKKIKQKNADSFISTIKGILS